MIGWITTLLLWLSPSPGSTAPAVSTTGSTTSVAPGASTLPPPARFRIVYIVLATIRGAPTGDDSPRKAAEEIVKKTRPHIAAPDVAIEAREPGDSGRACPGTKVARECFEVIFVQQARSDTSTVLVNLRVRTIRARRVVKEDPMPTMPMTCDNDPQPFVWQWCREKRGIAIAKMIGDHYKVERDKP